jgi:uncharacterized protein GlcG (DUF336 family)
MLSTRTAAFAGWAFLFSMAMAQTPPTGNLPGDGGGVARITDSPDPAALPGDFFDMTQDRQLTVNLGPPAGTRSTRPPVTDPTPSPGSALALEAVQTVVDSCAADGYVVAAAVTDAAGKLKAALAPDGTRSNGVFMALRKDVTVVAFKMSTLALRQQLASNPSLRVQIKPNMALLPGGIPIMKGDVLIGAISASGAAAYEEEKCATAGLQKIQSRLK